MKIVGKWRWNEQALYWEKWDGKSTLWLREHRPLPQWFISSGAEIPLAKFITIWTEAEILNDVCKELHWLGISEIEALYQGCNHILAQQGLKTLPSLSLQVSPIQSSERLFATIQNKEITQLLQKGLLEEDNTQPIDDDGNYDSMKALLNAQKQRTEEGTIQFQSIEVAGRYRFTARH